MICTVTTLANLVANADLTVQWSGGGVGSAGVIVSVTTVSGVTSTRTLTFSPLLTSHVAQYTCQATINIPSISVTKTGSNSTGVMVQSKWLLYIYCIVGKFGKDFNLVNWSVVKDLPTGNLTNDIICNHAPVHFANFIVSPFRQI